VGSRDNGDNDKVTLDIKPSYSQDIPAQSTNYMGSNTAVSYFLYETTYTVNASILDRSDDEELWRRFES
jgi:hypothetical protein